MAGVLDDEHRGVVLATEAYDNAAARVGELDGIADDVCDHLLQPARIADDLERAIVNRDTDILSTARF